jgi:hypothetical protein
MELAAAPGTAKAGGLIMAAIAHVFTISYVANQLDEDEDWLRELSTDIFPEDGCLWVYGVGEDGVPAFTKHGIENLRQIIADQRAAGRAPPHNQVNPTQ